MILQTMNDSEKFYEGFRVVYKAKDLYDEVKREAAEKIMQGRKFPYYRRYAFEDNGNKWRLVFLCKSKAHRKKRWIYTFCYTTYSVEKQKKDVNCGKGILWFDPIATYNFVRSHGTETTGMCQICDITPHAFNRYTERFLKPMGLTLEFDRKVEDILYRWKWFDIIGDKSSEKYTDNVISSYDVFMNGGGMLRGQILNGMSMRFFTYISEDMYYSNQLQRQQKMFREYHHFRREGFGK